MRTAMMRRRVIAAALAMAAVVLCGAAYVLLASRQAVLATVAGRAGVVPSATGASPQRGASLYRAARCAACHAADGGGAPLIDDPRIATLWSPNLTRANPGVGIAYSDADFERAIRRGLRPSGQRLLGMPSLDYVWLSDADVASIVAFLRTLRPVTRDAPPFRMGALGRIEILTGALAFDSDRIGDHHPARTATVDGAYVARFAGCMRCHAVDRAPPPPPLPGEHAGRPMNAFRGMPYGDFARAVLRGAASGIASHAAPALPSALDERELRALYAYATAYGLSEKK